MLNQSPIEYMLDVLNNPDTDPARRSFIFSEASPYGVYCCAYCGRAWFGRRKDYCSDKCSRTAYNESRVRFKAIVCQKCGKIFESQNPSKYCKDCVPKVLRDKAKKYTCKKCGKEFVRPKRHGEIPSFCSRKCAGNGEIGNAKTIFIGKGSHYRRAKRFKVEYERINPNDIFLRDGWTCQICGASTPQKHRGTKRNNAPELDHIIPISKGGSHIKSNVQCACRKCNAKKGNKNSAGQLSIFSLLEV